MSAQDNIISKFKTYLEKSGAVLVRTTNQYELVRFKTLNGTSVVYRNKKGVFTFTGEAEEAYDKMLKKGVWVIIPNGLKIKAQTLKDIIERDGEDCFYCGCKTTDKDRTIEHILSVAHGGNNNINNLSLSCKKCNVIAGSKPIVEKIAFRDKQMFGKKT